MTTKEVTIRGDKELALYELETRFAMAVRQRELLETYIRERLKSDKHFYTVGDDPGRKPSLTKEGAELICLPHALKGHYCWMSGPESPPLDDSPYQITMKCELESNEKFAGEGVGSASSMVTKKDGSRVQRQKDPGLRHNATIKMACKSAYIAATLNSTAASEFFTQDLEDDQTGEIRNTDQKTHWCAEHKTAFFMRGKMKSFAHPIGDTGEWCHEHTENKQKQNNELTQASVATSPLPPEPPPASPESTTEATKTETKTISPFETLMDESQFADAITSLSEKSPGMWGKKPLVVYLKSTYQIEVKKSFWQAVCQLKETEAKVFFGRIQESLKLA